MNKLVGIIKKILAGTLIAGAISLPTYSLAKMYHTKFTSSDHIQLRNSYGIDEVYYMDDNQDGKTDRIKLYAGAVVGGRGIYIIPFEYHPEDERFQELLEARDNPQIVEQETKPKLPQLEELVGQPLSVNMYPSQYMGNSHLSATIRTENKKIVLCNLESTRVDGYGRVFWSAQKLTDATALIQSEINDEDSENIKLRGFYFGNPRKFHVTSITANSYTLESTDFP